MGDSAMNGLSAKLAEATAWRFLDAAKGRVHAHGRINPLLKAAHPLLLQALELKRTDTPMPIETLRDRLGAMIETFHDEAERHAIDKQTLASASYCLCTFLDEIVATTSWGADGAWANRSLLVMFYGEASGGEHFFSILSEISEKPGDNRDVLELIAVLLALGMEGRYRLLGDGGEALGRIRRNLHQLIRTAHGSPPQTLSVPWTSELPHRSICVTRWMVAGLIGVSLVFYGCLAARLHWMANRSVHAFTRMSPSLSQAWPPPLVHGEQLLASRLAAEVAAGIVSIDAKADRATITLHTDALFASGGTTLLPAQQALIERLSRLLREIPGRIMIIGYTDDQPPLPGAPSNWQLSVTRANNIAALLRTEDDPPGRFLIQGRGDAEPVATNTTPAGRARNRRVAITLLAPAAAP
jgi:type VI secretion system protein ImpK